MKNAVKVQEDGISDRRNFFCCASGVPHRRPRAARSKISLRQQIVPAATDTTMIHMCHSIAQLGPHLTKVCANYIRSNGTYPFSVGLAGGLNHDVFQNTLSVGKIYGCSPKSVMGVEAL